MLQNLPPLSSSVRENDRENSRLTQRAYYRSLSRKDTVLPKGKEVVQNTSITRVRQVFRGRGKKVDPYTIPRVASQLTLVRDKKSL